MFRSEVVTLPPPYDQLDRTRVVVLECADTEGGGTPAKEARLGAANPWIGMVLSNLALIRQDRGKFEEALRLLLSLSASAKLTGAVTCRVDFRIERMRILTALYGGKEVAFSTSSV